MLFTGYYLPELRGSLEPSGVFTHPLLAPPADVVVARASDFPQLDRDLMGFVDNGRLLPLPDREAIRTGALDGKAAPVVWVDSVVDAFFLHIQGSGVVKLPDGSSRVVSYAGKNGHPYRAIGGELVRRGALRKEDVSMQSIRAWLDANPNERDPVLSTNPSYVFFQLGDAPRGSINVPVTPDAASPPTPGSSRRARRASSRRGAPSTQRATPGPTSAASSSTRTPAAPSRPRRESTSTGARATTRSTRPDT